MVTKDELFEKYGEDIIFLFKGDEPYTEALGNPLGVLLERDDKILCFECETWHETLTGPPSTSHLKQTHNMTADEYKEKWGFNYSASLCSRKVSEAMRERSLKAQRDNPQLLKKMAAGRKRAFAARKANGFRTRGKKSMQASNARASCPEQIKQRYRLLQAKYGNDVGLNTIRVTDPYVEAYAVRNFGSWNAFKKVIGEPTKEGGPMYQKEKADLIYDLRMYVEKYNKLPWDAHSKKSLNGFPHSITPYETQWGTLSNAYLVCGINGSYFKNEKGYAEKYWSVDPEYAAQAAASEARLNARGAVMPVLKTPEVNNSVRIVTEKMEILRDMQSTVAHGFTTWVDDNTAIKLTNKGKKVLGRPVTT